EAILRRGDRRDDLRWLYELRVEHSDTDSERTSLLNEWARLEETAFGDVSSARSLYARALQLAPDDPAALEASVRLARTEGDWAATASGLERQRQLASGDGRALKDLELAEVYAERLGRPDEALAVIYEALELD